MLAFPAELSAIDPCREAAPCITLKQNTYSGTAEKANNRQVCSAVLQPHHLCPLDVKCDIPFDFGMHMCITAMLCGSSGTGAACSCQAGRSPGWLSPAPSFASRASSCCKLLLTVLQ